MQVMLLLFPRDYPFLTEPLSVLSRFWFWQLRNCPLPNSMGRPSILVPKSLVSSSFWEVTALRTGEELLMRGSKARLGDLIWWDQKQTNVKSTKNRDTWSCCKFCLERATYLWSGPNPKENQINIYLKLRGLEFFDAEYQLSQQREENKSEIPYLSLRDNCCSVLVLSFCGHCRELWLLLTDPRASIRLAASGLHCLSLHIFLGDKLMPVS